MTESGRKGSEDLIREANQRLRGSAAEPDPVAEDAPVLSGSSAASFDSGETLSPPQAIEYRSQQSPVSEEQTTYQGPIETGPPPRRSWLRSTLARLVVSGLFLGGWFLFTTFDDAKRDDSGEIVGSGDLGVLTLQIGDCFNDPEELEDVVYDVAAVPCADPHDNEVFAVQPLGAAFGGDFPGVPALDEHSYEVCSGALFDAYVGTPYAESSLEVFTLTPTQESWDQGDREFVCALYRLDFGSLTGTARDSGL